MLVHYAGKGEHVEVYTNNGTIEAEFVIVAASLGTLKRKSFTFFPELPVALQTAITRLGCDVSDKVRAVYICAARMYPHNGLPPLAGAHASYGDATYLRMCTFSNTHAFLPNFCYCEQTNKVVMEFPPGSAASWGGAALDAFYHIGLEPDHHGEFVENWNINHYNVRICAAV